MAPKLCEVICQMQALAPPLLLFMNCFVGKNINRTKLDHFRFFTSFVGVGTNFI